MEKIQPLGLQVLVEPDPVEKQRQSGIIIPDTVTEKPNRGTVVSVGETVPNLKAGDRILYGKFSGTELVTEEKKYLIMNYKDIFAILHA